jgi:ubiquinone/menaquinone biosynthesis C-methylase UbiE
MKVVERHPRQSKDYLWLHLCELPYFRGLLRAVEASYYERIDFPNPILDVGAGDGHFATVAFDEPLDVGIDPWMAPMREARRRGGYHLLTQADGGRLPFADRSFGSAFSNSVLEHIPHVESVLEEVSRVLKPGAPFAFCVPNHQFNPNLSIGQMLDQVHLTHLGDTYRRFFDRIAHHQHLDSPETWQARLEKAGFELEQWWHYYPPPALHVTEWGHFFGLPSLVWQKLTGRWILAPTRWNLGLTYSLTRRYYDTSEREDGVCTFFIARRQGGRQEG